MHGCSHIVSQGKGDGCELCALRIERWDAIRAAQPTRPSAIATTKRSLTPASLLVSIVFLSVAMNTHLFRALLGALGSNVCVRHDESKLFVRKSGQKWCCRSAG